MPKNNRKFYKRLFILAIPIVLQNLITSSLNMLDTMMIGSLGEVQLAAVGVANQFYFLYSLLVMGIGAGCSILIAQLWGKEDTENVKKVLQLGLAAGIVFAVIFTVIGFFGSESIIKIFNPDPDVIHFGSEYLRVSIFSYLATAISFVFAGALRSIGNTALPMWGSLIGLIINGVFNAILIFGLLGFPALGVVGAAIATLMARLVECFIIIIVVALKVKPLNLSFKQLVTFDRLMAGMLYQAALPVVLNEACWGLTNITYNIIYGRMGVNAIATTQITTTIMNLFMIVVFGMAHASVVVIGNEIGANQEEQAIIYAKKIIRLALIIAVVMAVGLV
ncbi:MATE family efflux transporter, partial [Turicibacter sanguinis]|nr:MATE family efflux transporter [Turicibacter sanguinis]